MPDDSHLLDHPTSSVTQHRYKKPKIEWMSFSGLPFDTPRWLIEGLVPAESLVMLYGARGQGKTFLAIDIAASIATGRPCLGRKIVEQGRVAYLLAERPEGLKRRLFGWLEHQKKISVDWSERDREITANGLDNIFAADNAVVALDHEEDRKALIASIKQHLRHTAQPAAANSTEAGTDLRLKLLIVDPLASHMSGSENSTQDMTAFMNGVREVSKELGCSVLLIHHEGKRNFNNLLGARGSSALEAALDTILYMLPLQGRTEEQQVGEGKQSSNEEEGEEGENITVEADGAAADISELRMTKQREFKETPKVWLKFGEVEGIPSVENAGGLPSGDLKVAIPLGKFPVVIEAPKAKTRVGKRAITQAFKERLREDIYRFIAETHDSKPGFLGVTVDEVHAYFQGNVRNEDRPRLKHPKVIRELLDDLHGVGRIGRAGRKPYKHYIGFKMKAGHPDDARR